MGSKKAKNQKELIETGTFGLWETVGSNIDAVNDFSGLIDISLTQTDADLQKIHNDKTQFTNTDEQKEILREVIDTAQENLKQLQLLDAKIMVSGSLAVITYFLIPVWFISVASTAICAWHISQREEALYKHKHALKNLAQAWAWAQNHDEAEKHMKDLTILEMRKILFPLLTKSDIYAITSDKIENEQFNKANEQKKQMKFFGFTMDDKALNLYHKMYGYNQKGLTAFLETLAYSLYQASSNAIIWCYNRVQEINNTNTTSYDKTINPSN